MAGISPAGVGVGDGAHRRPAVADRRVGHVDEGLAQERQRGIRVLVALELSMADQGADPHVVRTHRRRRRGR